jgi:nucleoside-diphosphate-sugar epimerase
MRDVIALFTRRQKTPMPPAIRRRGQRASPEMTRVCILGSAGFIGRRLFDHMRRAHPECQIVTDDLAPHPESSDHHVCDITSRDLLSGPLAAGAIHSLINLAAEHRDDVLPLSRYYEVNVGGAENVCALARQTGARQIIFTSSVAVYGFAPPGTGEDGAINPFHEYGRTKALAEEVYRAWQGEAPESRSLVIIRPTVVFGPGNRGNVYRLLKQIASGLFAMIGDGRNVKSMAYVENVAAFIANTLSFQAGIHVYNYVDTPDLSMAELVATVRMALRGRADGYVTIPRPLGHMLGSLADLAAAVLRRPLPVSALRVEKFCATTQFSTAAAATGFVPPFTLEEGLRQTLAAEFPSR